MSQTLMGSKSIVPSKRYNDMWLLWKIAIRFAYPLRQLSKQKNPPPTERRYSDREASR